MFSTVFSSASPFWHYVWMPGLVSEIFCNITFVSVNIYFEYWHLEQLFSCICLYVMSTWKYMICIPPVVSDRQYTLNQSLVCGILYCKFFMYVWSGFRVIYQMYVVAVLRPVSILLHRPIFVSFSEQNSLL